MDVLVNELLVRNIQLPFSCLVRNFEVLEYCINTI